MALKKGFVHLIPLFAVAVVIVGVLATLSAYQENSQKAALGKVLSDSDTNQEQIKKESEQKQESDKKQVEAQKESDNKSQEVQKESEQKQQETDHQNSAGGFTFSSHVKEENESKKSEVQMESQHEGSNSAKFEGQIQNGNLKIEIHVENGKVVTKFHDENGQEVEVEKSVGDKLAKEADDTLEEKEIEIATGSAQLGFIEHGHRVRTNFPLTVDPATGQLFVTTPTGTKAVAILPAAAIENMIRAGILTTVTGGGGSNPPGGTDSASTPTSVLGATTELTTGSKGNLVYKVSGEKSERLLGVLPVNFNLTAVVSAENGQLLSTQESIFARILDLLSF